MFNWATWPVARMRQRMVLPGAARKPFSKEKRLAIIAMAALAALLVGTPATLTAVKFIQATPKDVTTVYNFDPVREKWVKTVESVPVPLNEDGSTPKGSNTVIINLRGDDPVKEIHIEEALITGGTGSLLEIRGHDDNVTGASGTIRIGELKFVKVDAERLEIDDTKVVRLTMQNVVADDNEIDIDIDIVNVVRILRGASSVLRLGVSRFDLFERLENSPAPGIREEAITPSEAGIRVDRIRILGPDSGKAFVERILIKRTGVAGKIEIRDVEIQDLILIDMTLDDS
ncbi:MAG: hypothetical protein HYX91_01095 [Chloroflexi bacterium]|nr:hypothetical protein [Chloroflexota bacterium]